MPPSQHLWKKPSTVLRKDSVTSLNMWYDTVSTPVDTLTFLDSQQGSFEFGESQRGVNRQTVIRIRVREVGLHFTTALAHVRRETVAVTRLGEGFGEGVRLGLVRAVDAVTLP